MGQVIVLYLSTTGLAHTHKEVSTLREYSQTVMKHLGKVKRHSGLYTCL